MKKPETIFRENKVLPFLKTLSTRSHHFPLQSVSFHGLPDYLLVIRGDYVALELKNDVGRLSASQEYQLDRIWEAGGIVLVAWPGNWHEVKGALKWLDEGIIDGKGKDYLRTPWKTRVTPDHWAHSSHKDEFQRSRFFLSVDKSGGERVVKHAKPVPKKRRKRIRYI